MTFQINNNINNQNIIILGSDAENESAENAIASSNDDSGPLVVPELLEKIFKFTARDDQESLNNFKSFRQVCRFWHGVAHEAFLKPIWREVESFVFRNSLFKTKLPQINLPLNANEGVSLSHFKALSKQVSGNNSVRILPSDYQKLDIDLRDALLAVWGEIQPRITFEAKERRPGTAEEIQSWLNDPQNTHRMDGITSLTLINHGLKILPPEIGKLRNLQELSLWNNQLTDLPDTLGKLRNLQWLQLWDNQLSTLPDTISNLGNLQELNLSNNQLTILPDTISDLEQLQRLNLSNNQLTILSDRIGDLGQLRRLYLSGNQLTTLPDTIGKLGNLQELDLSNNQLTILPDSLSNLRELWELHLSNNQLTTFPDTRWNRTFRIKVNGNTWVFIFDNEAATNFHTQIFFKKLDDFTNYPTSSKLGKFFRAIGTHDLIAIKNSFNDLDESVKRKIEKTFRKKKEGLANYVDLFTDMGLLVRSVHNAIRDLYRSLDGKQQELVCWHVWNLAGRPNNGDPNWGGTHLFDHLLRFSDALETVVSQSIMR